MTRHHPTDDVTDSRLTEELTAILRAGDAEECADRCRQRLRQSEPSADIHCLLGEALVAMGNEREAMENLHLALRLNPDHTAARFALGNVLASMQAHEEAATIFSDITMSYPHSAAAHFNLGNAQFALGRFVAAAESYQSAANLQPSAEAYNNLGTALASCQQLHAAEQAFRTALQNDPNFVAAQLNLARALSARKAYSEAVNWCHRAIDLAPRMAACYRILANALENLGMFEAAVAVYERLVVLEPDQPDAYLGLGYTRRVAGHLAAATTAYQTIIGQQPDFAEAHSNLGEVLRLCGDLSGALSCQREAVRLNPQLPEAHSNVVLTMQYMDECTQADILAESRCWHERHVTGIQCLPARGEEANGLRRLRLGYVSGDFRCHPIGFFIEPILQLHDRNQFEVTCYATQEMQDDQTRRLRRFADRWLDVESLTDSALADRIRADQMDILVDLSGHTGRNRLLTFARKPAPVQATWLGYSNTTGLDAMDYIIADRWVIPPSEDHLYSEQVCRLPESYLCFSPPDLRIPKTRAPESSAVLTFGSFNNLAKVTSKVIEVWSCILRRLPHSVLFLKTKALCEAAVCDNLAARFAVHGIQANQLRFEGYSPRADLLAAYRDVDIALDPFPFNGGITTLEAIWMSVPVISLAGERFVGHVGECIHQTMGTSELIAKDIEDYIELAIQLGSDRCRLANWREQLRPRLLQSPLCDHAAFTQSLENALMSMWSHTRSGLTTQ